MLALALWASLVSCSVSANSNSRAELIEAIAELSARSGPPGAYQNKKSALMPAGLMQESLWQRLQSRFQFTQIDHPTVDKQLDYFTNGLFSLRSNLIDAKPILYHIVDEIDRAGLPLDLVLLPLVESAYNPHAESNRDAVGIWQFIPATARIFGLKINEDYDGRKDVIASTRAAIKYLLRLNKTFDGDWLLAMAAYNTGPSNVRAAMSRAEAAGLEPIFWNLSLATETRNYVPRIIAAAKLIANPQQFGLELPELANRKAIETVSVGRPMSLTRVAELADFPVAELIALNPGYLRGEVPRGGPYEVFVPAKHASQLVHQLNNGKLGNPIIAANQAGNNAVNQYASATIAGFYEPPAHNANRASASGYQFKPYKKYVYRSHVVEPGESLWKISRDMQTDVDTLLDWNGESDKALQPGDRMIVAYLDDETGSDLSPKLINYRVHANDSLISITDKFNLSIGELKKWNPALWNKNHLQPGQSIRIPVTITSDSGQLPGAF